MPIKPVGTLRDFVLNGVEKCALVGGPGDACDALDLLGKGTARLEIFYVKRISAEAGRIGRIGEQLIIIADLEGTQPKKRMSLGKLIEVQQQRFGGLQYRVRISIFCFQVGDNFGVFFMAEPRVMVDAAVAV